MSTESETADETQHLSPSIVLREKERESLAADVAAFLKSGGKITQCQGPVSDVGAIKPPKKLSYNRPI